MATALSTVPPVMLTITLEYPFNSLALTRTRVSSTTIGVYAVPSLTNLTFPPSSEMVITISFDSVADTSDDATATKAHTTIASTATAVSSFAAPFFFISPFIGTIAPEFRYRSVAEDLELNAYARCVLTLFTCPVPKAFASKRFVSEELRCTHPDTRANIFISKFRIEQMFVR